MISFRLRTKWQNCRGYVPCYERTPKNEGVVIHSVFATHCETVVLLNNKFAKAKDFVQIGIDAEDYYRIKDAKRNE